MTSNSIGMEWRVSTLQAGIPEALKMKKSVTQQVGKPLRCWGGLWTT